MKLNGGVVVFDFIERVVYVEMPNGDRLPITEPVELEGGTAWPVSP